MRLQGARLFLAVCEMCVFRYKQHSSRDKPLGPPSPQPPPSSVSPPTMLTQVCERVGLDVCVCVFVFTLSGGPWALYPRHLQGGDRKDSCVFERNRET